MFQKQHCIPLELPHTIRHPRKVLHIRGLHLDLTNVFQYIPRWAFVAFSKRFHLENGVHTLRPSLVSIQRKVSSVHTLSTQNLFIVETVAHCCIFLVLLSL